MFDRWRSDPAYPTLVRVDRTVAVRAAEALPTMGSPRADELPLWVRASGLRVEAHMLARQVAWIRRCDGRWLACLQVPAASSNRRSQVVIPMWVDEEFVSLDVSTVQAHERPRGWG